MRQPEQQHYAGGCHCSRVRFEFTAPSELEVLRCNCSICQRIDYLHLVVPHSCFTLLTDPAVLTEYRFNTGAARHLFCSQCGIKAYYQPRSHPACWSVNARCVDGLDPARLKITDFDGRHWSAAQAELTQ